MFKKLTIRKLICSILLVLLLCSCSIGFQDDSFMDGQLTLLVEDTLDDISGQSFSLRSSIHVRSIKSGNAVVTHTRDWTEHHSKILKDLSAMDGLYQIRIQQKGAQENEYVSTFTKACLLGESGLSDILTIMLDGSGNSIVGVGLATPISVCEGEPLISASSFNTTVIIRSPIQAPIPDTATYIQKMDAMKAEKAEGRDNRSFLSKYWMYIVPVLVLLLVSGNQEAPAQGR